MLIVDHKNLDLLNFFIITNYILCHWLSSVTTLLSISTIISLSCGGARWAPKGLGFWNAEKQQTGPLSHLQICSLVGEDPSGLTAIDYTTTGQGFSNTNMCYCRWGKVLLSQIVTQVISVTNFSVTIVRFIVAQYMCSCWQENVLQPTCRNTYNVFLCVRKCVTTVL